MNRELSQAELIIVFAALVDAATLVQALCRNNDNEVLDHLHTSLSHAIKVMTLPLADIWMDHSEVFGVRE